MTSPEQPTPADDPQNKPVDPADKNKDSDRDKSDEIQYFDTMVVKLVEKENEETGEKEWVEVMSDNLYPGEKLKREVDEENAKEKADQAKEDAKAQRDAEDEATGRKSAQQHQTAAKHKK